MANHVVFTPASLQKCLELAPNGEWFASLDVPDDGSWDVLRATIEDCTFVIHRDDKPDARRIIVISQDDTSLYPVAGETLRPMFERIHRVVLGATKPPLRLPPGWKEFHEGNLVAFFAWPLHVGHASLRWIAEIGPERSYDVCFWKLTAPDTSVNLSEYEPPREIYRRVVGHWGSMLTTALSRFVRLPPTSPQTTAVETAIDLESATFGPVTQYRTYSTWLDHLTARQRQFLESPPDRPVKLKGPAGSGKTLALELKALREVYRARSASRDIRILFATHSWAVAEQIDSGLHTMDESGAITEIDVYPLLEIARSSLATERRVGPGFELLGEDSLAGRRLQLRRIDEIVERLGKSDWLTYRKHVSEQFRTRVEAPRTSPERNALVWDVMVEFSSVLSAHGILPGVNAERRYLPLERTPWMMPLESDADKRVVLQVYTDYVAGLKEDRLLSTDQLINDFLNFLETFTWNIRREHEGYDLIFIDELHLFSEQERLVLHYLTRSASEYPRMFMALDPRQAPFEVFAEFPVGAVARGESGRADLDLGAVASVELSKIHRFTPEILALVQHIHRSYPALELGPDWEVDLDKIESGAEHGERPQLFLHPSQAEEAEKLTGRVEEIWDAMKPDSRIAVILLDALQLPEYQKGFEENSRVRLCVIQSRDDVESLRYSRRSVVLGPAEYLAGLQFDYVMVAGMPDTRLKGANLGYQLRRLLTLLYLAVSRASRHVEIYINDEKGGIPEILESALSAGVIRRE